jgi:beta-1,4-mannosyl-glycoprotein beta-1,4-N-acetylglucosaminyltransferase
VKRIAHQRNKLLDAVNSIANDDDYIFYSDNDEIPNMNSFLNLQKKNIFIFEQDLFYYKFNLYCNRIKWYGTRAIKKKKLIDFEWLRQIKPKRYPLYRIDTFFRKDKYININIVKNGGWHFTRVISPEEIHKKELDAEHHDEYRLSKKNPDRIKDLINRRVIDHDHLVDSKSQKYTKEFKLELYDLSKLPEYIILNQSKYRKFIDYK